MDSIGRFPASRWQLAVTVSTGVVILAGLVLAWAVDRAAEAGLIISAVGLALNVILSFRSRIGRPKRGPPAEASNNTPN